MIMVAAVLIVVFFVASFFNQSNNFPFFEIISLFIIGMITAFILSFIFAKGLSKIATLPLKTINTSLAKINNSEYENLFDNSIFNEATTTMHEINSNIMLLVQKIHNLADDKEKVSNLLDNMNEGIIVLDSIGRVLTINQVARQFFATDESIIGKNILHMSHLKKLYDSIMECTTQGVSITFDTVSPSHHSHTLRIYLSPVPENTDKENRSNGVIALITDVTDILKLEKIRSEFTSNASHELKTPLTSISGFAELIDSGLVKDEETIHKYLGNIRRETSRMMVLINDILNLSELESVNYDMNREWLDIGDVIKTIFNNLAVQAKGKNITLQFTGESALIFANRGRMVQLFLNLIENAVKYNNENGSVSVNTFVQDRLIHIKIADTGMGIPKKDQSRIFERFYRVDKGRSRDAGGTGLGLSIVKHIVGLYKGAITLESTLGEGTTINIVLPVG